MVQQALAVHDGATAEEIAAFIARWHAVRIEPKYIPVYRAALLDRQILEEKRKAARAQAPQTEGEGAVAGEDAAGEEST